MRRSRWLDEFDFIGCYDRNASKFSCRIQGNISLLSVAIQSLVHPCKGAEESYQLKPLLAFMRIPPGTPDRHLQAALLGDNVRVFDGLPAVGQPCIAARR